MGKGLVINLLQGRVVRQRAPLDIREAFNMASAAIDGKRGEPAKYRDYRLHSIMQNGAK